MAAGALGRKGRWVPLSRAISDTPHDGTISDVAAEEGSNQLLNLASQRAVIVTQRVPPLPGAFTPPQLTLHLVFQYQR